ncbi:Probable two-component sensor, near polyamine transporter [plant metagenome]|uniref:histidine kinase n=2 Tax=plant metagenome TaxID=1297885 RepID=A0A484P0P8_9ZZZZ
MRGLGWLGWLWLLLCMPATAAWANPAEAPAQSGCVARILAVHTAADVPGGHRAITTWLTVTLPDDWLRRRPGEGGSVWYRISWDRDCPGDRDNAVALVLQSIVLAGQVYVNDTLLWQDAHQTEPLSRSWNMPRYWLLPEAWLLPGVNTLWIRATSVAGQSLGLGPVHLGTPQAMQQRYDTLWWQNRTLILINIIVSGVMAALFFCIWVVRREQTAYGWYALMSLFWGLFIINVLLTEPLPLVGTPGMARLNTIALLLSVACFCLFTWRFSDQRLPRTERGLWLLTGGLVVLQLAAPDALAGKAQLLGLVVASTLFVLNGMTFLAHALRTRSREHGLLAACLLALVITNIHDLLAILSIIPSRPPLSPYTSIVITLSLSGILGLRHAHNVQRIARFNEELADNVARARTELADTLAREHALELSHTRLQDRLRIAHDLHDGVGGSLVHMMASVELGEESLARARVLSMLKLLRDDLRQAIDNDASAGVDAPATPQAWIAPVRYRYTQLFDALDMAVTWQVAAQWQARPSALQCLALTRFLEEALTNVIKHSHARQVRVWLEMPAHAVLVLGIEDDGTGFDVAAVRQAGLSVGMNSMHTRIARAGGTLEVDARPGRTVLAARVSL